MLGNAERGSATRSRSAAEWIEETDSLDEAEEAPSKWPLAARQSSSSGYSSGRSAPPSASSKLQSLAVIREGEDIPRPIWPCAPTATGCCYCCCSDLERRAACSVSYGSAAGSADCGALLELSRSLSAVLEGADRGAHSHQRLLRDISRSVAAIQQPRAAQPCSTYEELRPCGSESPATSSIGRVNPINSSLYQHRCYCTKKEEQARESQRSSSSAERTDPRGRPCAPTVFSLPQTAKCSSARIDENGRATIACNCSAERLGPKRALAISSSDIRDARSDYPSIEQHEYTTLECSDSSSSDASALSKDNTWPKDFRGFDKNLDFTLDGFKAERLGRAIAKAKRRRQWCRFIVVIFGLVFFILSLVIVSLSLTKGRKVFGSM